MATVSIRFSERLKQEKIFAPEKADAFASALNDELSDQLATKSDLLLVKNDIIQMENRLIKWMFGLVLASTAINLTAIGYLMSVLISLISQSTAVS